MGSGGGFPSNFPGATPPDAPKEINFVKEAFNIQYNWIALAALGVLALLSWSALPLILAGGLELMYLAVVPQNWRFQRLVRSWKFGEQQQAREKKLGDILRNLPPDMQTRYVNLARVCASIRNNYTQLTSTSQIFVQQMDQRLQGLLNGYARLLGAAWQQRQYLKTADADSIKKEIALLEQRLSQDPPKVQEINKRRIEILGKRVEKNQKIVENRQVVDAQCSAVEDVLELVRDQSVTMRDPQQISDQLANLVHDVEQTEQTVQQVEAIFSNLTPDLDGIIEDAPQSSSFSAGSPQRTRIGS